ncbi:hypothetical protein [Massilia litorea]|uniref:Uncharacterized protein n=1 Tax=Massilia litorea TaxID=2769491 RepID=A0A7L9U827_9BURK|nr:hypothetical protein [Massilia litorea]QOL50236.1 hypothetical protein LPB04_02670 [Massilia litorea]
MTYCSTYIGDLHDPKFDINNFEIGNLPRNLCPSFPPVGEHYNRPFHDWVGLREVPIKETDYTAYVATLSKSQIEDYIRFAYDSDPSYNDPKAMLTWEGKAYLVEKLNEIKDFVATLDPCKEYALVAECD